MASYILTNKALEDLSRIWEYTFNQWSEEQADKYYHIIIESCEDLGSNALSGKRYPEVHAEVLGYRIGQHIIFYRHLTNQKIEIARILHSRMDLRLRIEE